VCRKFYFFLGKSTKTVATKAALLVQICIKSFVSWGFAPDPHWGNLQCSPDLLPAIMGLLPRQKGKSKGKEREGREGQGKEAKGGEGRERGKGGRGSSAPPTLQVLPPPMN